MFFLYKKRDKSALYLRINFSITAKNYFLRCEKEALPPACSVPVLSGKGYAYIPWPPAPSQRAQGNGYKCCQFSNEEKKSSVQLALSSPENYITLYCNGQVPYIHVSSSFFTLILLSRMSFETQPRHWIRKE